MISFPEIFFCNPAESFVNDDRNNILKKISYFLDSVSQTNSLKRNNSSSTYRRKDSVQSQTPARSVSRKSPTQLLFELRFFSVFLKIAFLKNLSTQHFLELKALQFLCQDSQFPHNFLTILFKIFHPSTKLRMNSPQTLVRILKLKMFGSYEN